MKFKAVKLMPLLATAFLMTTVTTKTFAATSGSLTLSGSVGGAIGLVVTPNGANNTTLNITAGEAAKNVASVAETSNNLTGYHIDVVSANGAELRLNGTSTTYKTSYQISYDGGAYFSPTTSYTQIKNVASLTGLTTNNSAVLINVAAYALAPEGTYSDTLTFTIMANP